QWKGTYPAKGGVYTIDGASTDHPDSIFLAECVPVPGEVSCSWSVSRFRPVKTIEDDISEHFAQYLTVRGSAPVEMAS
ncbi:hypothetical protein ABK046_47840, partial [Streptomyces caeruleatus]